CSASPSFRRPEAARPFPVHPRLPRRKGVAIMARRQGRVLLTAALIWSLAMGASAQEAAPADPWDGVWLAEGTVFSLRVIRQDQRMFVTPVESLGFVWNSGVGTISGDTATIEVEYQGARGTVVVTQNGGGIA